MLTPISLASFHPQNYTFNPLIYLFFIYLFKSISLPPKARGLNFLNITYLNLSLSILVVICISLLFFFIKNNFFFMFPDSLVCESNLYNLTNPAQEIVIYFSSILPVVIYPNSDMNKEKIINENRNKSGVYRWTNILTGNTYVGSSVNLAKRFNSYFNFNYLSKIKMIISKAILKYGYSNFKLEILEYCESPIVIEREQYYLDLLKPEYNSLKTAGSSLGYKHTEETLVKLKTRVLTPEQLALATENLIKGRNSEEQRMAARERMIALNNKKGFKVEVTDQRTNITTTYPSLRKAAEALSTDLKAINYNQKVQKERGKVILFKKYYIVKINKLD